MQLRSTFGWSLYNLCALLRQQLFVYRDLFPWPDDPFQPLPLLQVGRIGNSSWTGAPSKWDSI